MYIDTGLQRIPAHDAAQLCWVLLSGLHVRPVALQTQIMLAVVKHLHPMSQNGLFSKYITTFLDKIDKNTRLKIQQAHMTSTKKTTLSSPAISPPASTATAGTTSAPAAAVAAEAAPVEHVWPSLAQMAAETVQVSDKRT